MSDLISRDELFEELNCINLPVGNETVDKIFDVIETLPSAQPETHEERTETHSCDLIDRQATIDALEKVAELFPWRVPGNRDSYDRYNEAWNDAIGRAEIEIEELPPAQPDNRLTKIADLMDGTIDHFDLDDAMDLLYQIKGVLKDG